MPWIIRCRVSGGVTGLRVGVLKDRDGYAKRFETEVEAQAEAARLMNREGPSVASFQYWPEEQS